jgi:hypothetical protein
MPDEVIVPPKAIAPAAPIAAPVVDPGPTIVPSDTEAVAICRCLSWHEQTQPTNRPYLTALAGRARKCLGITEVKV